MPCWVAGDGCGIMLARREAAVEESIFKFWPELPADGHIHPKDEIGLSRAAHGFDTKPLPNPFFGPLPTARVVLLFLSPGLRCYDIEQAKDPDAQAYFARQRTGRTPFPSQQDYPPTDEWFRRKFAQFGYAPDAVREKVAVLNICACRSRKFIDRHMLAAPPSSRICLDWAQSVLFSQAERGERVVICLRSAKYWGLDRGTDGRRFGKGLFVPRTARNGIMANGEVSRAAIDSVRAAIAA